VSSLLSVMWSRDDKQQRMLPRRNCRRSVQCDRRNAIICCCYIRLSIKYCNATTLLIFTINKQFYLLCNTQQSLKKYMLREKYPLPIILSKTNWKQMYFFVRPNVPNTIKLPRLLHSKLLTIVCCLSCCLFL